ncbi:hypothetical protein ES703_122190 [subsurface metagenome]
MAIAQAKKNSKTTQPISLNWLDSPSVQRLLDVVVAIVAEEYIQIAKQNPEIFSNNGGKKWEQRYMHGILQRIKARKASMIK